jgi:hypothetical protein
VRGQEIVLSQYALDSLLGIVAEDLGIDQVEIRAINAVTNNWTTANGIVVDVSGLPQCIETSAQMIGWKESRKARPTGRGIGFSCASHPSGTRLGGHFGSSVLLKLQEDGKVILTHGGTEIGQLIRLRDEQRSLYFEDVIQDLTRYRHPDCMFSDRCTFWDGNATISCHRPSKLVEIGAGTR